LSAVSSKTLPQTGETVIAPSPPAPAAKAPTKPSAASPQAWKKFKADHLAAARFGTEPAISRAREITDFLKKSVS